MAEQTGGTFPTGYLAENPLPSGIVGALGLSGYQLLAEVAGIGAGRLGSSAFLLVGPDPQPGIPAPGTQISLHQARLRDETDAVAYTQLAAQLGYLRLSGYRLVPERAGMRSKVNVMNPASGAVVLTVPEKHPGKLFGGGVTVRSLLASAQSLPPAGSPPDLQNPELLRQALLALALRDDSVDAVDAVDLADRALGLLQADNTLDPAAALQAAKTSGGQLGPGG
ncbi:MAG: hypothetical protein ACJ764_13445 [Solirubrobacteraceae bacterium]